MRYINHALIILVVFCCLTCNCISQSPRNEAEQLTLQGFDQFIDGKYNESIEFYIRAINADPTYAQAWINKGNSEMALKEYANAIESYDSALKIDPNLPIVWNQRGKALVNLQNYQEAIQSFDKALQYAPDYQDAKMNKDNATAKLTK